jgi:hypothetical protein
MKQRISKLYIRCLGITTMLAVTLMGSTLGTNERKTLQLMVHELYAADETGSSWFGKDEIYLGAVSAVIDPMGDYRIVKEYPHSMGSFDEDDRQGYTDYQLSWMELDQPFPKNILTNLVLIERDSGDQLHSSLDAIEQQMIIGLDEAKAQRHRAPAIAGVASTAVSAFCLVLPKYCTASYWADKVKSVYSSWREDDVFKPQLVKLQLASPDFRWGGSTRSSIYELSFKDHNGRYVLKYSWALL